MVSADLCKAPGVRDGVDRPLQSSREVCGGLQSFTPTRAARSRRCGRVILAYPLVTGTASVMLVATGRPLLGTGHARRLQQTSRLLRIVHRGVDTALLCEDCSSVSVWPGLASG
jgi:hypothetical protein